MNQILPFVAAASLGVSVIAQSTLQVGNGGFVTVNAAIDAAVAGDVIEVMPGTYAGFRLTKGVTVQAAVPGTVTIGHNILQSWEVPTDETARLVGIEFQSVIAVAGTYAFEGCRFTGGGTSLSALACDVHLERCELHPASSVIAIQGHFVFDGSVASMVDCTLNGTTALLSQGTSTIELRNGSRLVASGLVVNGGVPAKPQTALSVDASSAARITDSTLAAGPNQCAIVGGDVVCDRCTLAPNCPAFVGEPLLGIASSGPLRAGQLYTVTFRGQAGMPVLVFGSFDVRVTSSNLLSQPFLLDSAGCFPAAMLVAGTNGTASATFQIANAPLPAGIGLWLQGISGASFPLANSAAVGGVAR